jgi:protein ImuB
MLLELGIERVGQLLELPWDGLSARFPRVLERLDQATGRRAEAIVACRPLPTIEAEWTFEAPTDRREVVEAVLERLIGQVVGRLAEEDRGVSRLECRLAVDYGEEVRLAVGLFQPTGSAARLADLVRLHLERLPSLRPLAAVSVAAAAVGPLTHRQRQLPFPTEAQVGPLPVADGPSATAADAEDHRQAWTALVERLASRLGRRAVLKVRLVADVQPEYACRREPWIDAAPRGRGGKRTPALSPPSAQGAWRPLRLYARPAPLDATAAARPPAVFRLAGRPHRVRRWWGPERIETGWWRRQPVRRDYYRVETERGAWYWLFRRLPSGPWFAHGAFA